ncbi:MAG: glycoside hydrolase family 2 TIM barrel-domain containing protein [Ignavibacteria bacterium]|nr:glycoside hydrolase family 2 TIM barrel-domain containing protein [Ignavibacteria bacterium]
MFAKHELNKNWTFSLAESSYPIENIKNKKLKPRKQFAASVPGTIHTDLLNNNLIEDPFYSDNELTMNWISECDWLYQTKFDFHSDTNKSVDLVFEGIDTISEIYLNNRKLDSTNNMFLTYSYNVKNILKPTDNTLKVVLKSPVRYALQQEKKYGKLPVALNSSRVYIRKAQYSFGWDWGPSFPTSGIWRKVYLQERPNVKIDSLVFNTKKISKNFAEVEVVTKVDARSSKNILIHLSLSNGDSHYEKKIPIKSGKECRVAFKIKNPKLWWPNGEGEQALYSLHVRIVDDKNVLLDEVKRKVGVRTTELVLKEKEELTFKFRINRKDIYCKGVNWIPADSFLPRVSEKKYSDLLSLAKQANINMVRVWGGGIYENDDFYNLCDELGFLVWQDFMFACGAYPENDEFISNVSEEVTQNVLRLQHHACLALWCGNNENEWIWFQGQNSSYKKMPGYKIFHNILPKLLKKIDPQRPYWESSPFGNDDDPNSFESGNTHQWNIWSKWIDYDEVKNDRSLFVTEFGFQGPANKDTFEKYLPVRNRKISDQIFEHHNKQVEGPERLIRFLSGHLPVKTEWNDYLYLTQLNQAFALKTCLEYWRTNGRTNGSIIWQLNDCWPVTSWAIVDSDIKPKMAYYFVKNSFALRLLSFKDEESKIKILLLNQDQDSIKGRLRLTVISSITGEIIQDSNSELTTNKSNSTEIHSIVRKNLPPDENWIIIAALYDELNKIICKNYFLTKPWKHIRLKKPKLKLKILAKHGSTQLVIKSDNPVFFVDLYHPDLLFSDRGFFILPGEQIELNVFGEHGKSIKVEDIKNFSLNNYLHE